MFANDGACVTQVLTETMDKNYQHLQNPEDDLMAPYTEEHQQEVFEEYVEPELQQLLVVASKEDLEHAWKPMSAEQLQEVDLRGYTTMDKDALEKLEEKQRIREEKKKADEEGRKKKKKPNVALLQRKAKQINKDKREKKQQGSGGVASSSKLSTQPQTPPPNQLASTSSTGACESHFGSLKS